MEGVEKVDIEELPGNGNDGFTASRYQHYNFVRKGDCKPRVFITCKKTSQIQKVLMTLDEKRVKRQGVSEMDLYMESMKVLLSGFIKNLSSEMEEFKAYLLRIIGLENMDFIHFPEKLFYIFVITCRNLDRAELGQGMNRKLVVEELIMVGNGKKLADDIATCIVNIRLPTGERKRFKKRADCSEEDQLRSLSVMGMFTAFEEHYKTNREFDALQITTSLTTKFGYPDEAARRISPLVAQTDDSESWLGYLSPKME
jgi:hypothetical protein